MITQYFAIFDGRNMLPVNIFIKCISNDRNTNYDKHISKEFLRRF